MLSRLANGYFAFGDSNSAGAGYLPSYPAQLDAAYFPPGSPFANYAVSGSQCIQQTVAVFNDLNPQPTGNPIVSNLNGFNDNLSTDPAIQLYYRQCQMAGSARAGLNSISGTTSKAPAEGPSKFQVMDRSSPIQSAHRPH